MSLNINKEYNNLYSLAKTYYDYSQLVKKLGDTESQKVYLQQCMHYAEQMDATHRAEHVANELAVLS
jgi:hypothetical protein